ncbi:hypothetical protein GLI01_02680 [Gluconacetobacter liquefaciens]|uniref:Uncharacterized protein n=1 Tax=Gluconacetobacter liquefaciens TaxID=89584 RepID=A0A370G706_GLULI|nr:hypothetical protein [Gluconacetobacter liquefaciens]MBB2185785.1 hypothetical protein [Gluconacetobacter liquefaciens]RDI39595.1 hypothetical protein C7453_102389 [Gluconacetobacter liquefaciens]GBR09279.1 hypothetical protein AA0522_2314 [Gluconacetobacter liquefaciens NRIC 0522]GEB36233.1 hypothetical protein GLI01_02680 [Gluconacetobacter liquefaciens]
MTDGQFETKLEEGVGRLQDGLGGLLGDPVLQMKGKGYLLCAKARSAGFKAGDAVRDLTVDQPVVAVVTAGLAGFALAMAWVRR